MRVPDARFPVGGLTYAETSWVRSSVSARSPVRRRKKLITVAEVTGVAGWLIRQIAEGLRKLMQSLW